MAEIGVCKKSFREETSYRISKTSFIFLYTPVLEWEDQATEKEPHFGNLRINTQVLVLSVIEANRDKTFSSCRALSPQKYV